MLTGVIVRGNSMHPALHDGDIVFVLTGGEKLKTGDVIVYRESRQGFLVIHRIESMIEKRFITRGDGNQECDPISVTPEQIVGKVRFVIPWLRCLTKKIREGGR